MKTKNFFARRLSAFLLAALAAVTVSCGTGVSVASSDAPASGASGEPKENTTGTPVETGETASPAVPFPTGAQLKPFLAAFRGSRKSLAEMLGVSERTLYRRLAELQEK